MEGQIEEVLFETTRLKLRCAALGQSSQPLQDRSLWVEMKARHDGAGILALTSGAMFQRLCEWGRHVGPYFFHVAAPKKGATGLNRARRLDVHRVPFSRGEKQETVFVH